VPDPLPTELNAEIIRPSRISFLTLSAHAVALEQIYQDPEVFISDAFGSRPQPKVLWLTAAAQAEIARILGHPPTQLRQRYWADGAKSVWILEEIGKEEPITAGFVIANGRIDHARVLVYRESRGSEVRYPSFLRQFKDATLTSDAQLSHAIDGISEPRCRYPRSNGCARRPLP
jgi:hypothetical protein